MKTKKHLAFLIAVCMLLSLTACGKKNGDDDDDETTTIKTTTTTNKKSDDSFATILDQDEINAINKADDNAGRIYEAVKIFAEKCETAGKKFAKEEDVTTEILTVGTSDSETGRASNIGVIADTNSLAEGTKEELIKVVSRSCGDDLNGSCFVVVFNKRGYPKFVYWASNESNISVGRYPSDDNYAFTTGGIKSIVENGSDAYGDVIIP